MSLVFSLCAALAATLVQQWARAYLRPFQRQDSLLKTLWIQIVLSEGVDRLQVVAGAVPGFIHLSLILYYICSVVASITNPQWPYPNPLSNEIWHLIHNLHLALYNSISRRRVVESRRILLDQGHLATDLTTGSRAQDVRAVRWLLDKINGSNKVDTFVLAIPGTFDQEWSQNVWKAVVGESQLAPPEDLQDNDVPRVQEGNTVFDLCTRVRQLFEAYNHNTDSMNEAERKRMHGCVETTACLVCCADVPPSWFGEVEEVGEVLSEVGHNERINESLAIRSNPSFAVRWTCLSLVAIRQTLMAEGNRVRELAGFAVSGIARFQLDYGAPDSPAFNGAQRIDKYFKTAWEHVEELYRTFELWDQTRTGEEIRNILEACESQISELERIENEANGMDDVDWRISLLQDAMDTATHKLTRRLPGASFNELKSSGPIPITEAFDFPISGSTPITPQFIFPGQQLQPLFALGRGLRSILEGRCPEKHKEVLEGLESVGKILIPLRRLNHLMKRQLWRLQDLRDGGGLGFTIELFFLALRQLSSASLTSESKKGFYIRTFNFIASRWMDDKDSFGTQGILLDLVCDLVIEARGVFSDFPYPAYIVDELLELVGKMVDGHGGLHKHINDAVKELQDFNPGESVDWDLALQERARLRDKALEAIKPPENAALPT